MFVTIFDINSLVGTVFNGQATHSLIYSFTHSKPITFLLRFLSLLLIHRPTRPAPASSYSNALAVPVKLPSLALTFPSS
jgi:hypothetical protein